MAEFWAVMVRPFDELRAHHDEAEMTAVILSLSKEDGQPEELR
jgi:hypothetical protein